MNGTKTLGVAGASLLALVLCEEACGQIVDVRFAHGFFDVTDVSHPDRALAEFTPPALGPTPVDAMRFAASAKASAHSLTEFATEFGFAPSSVNLPPRIRMLVDGPGLLLVHGNTTSAAYATGHGSFLSSEADAGATWSLKRGNFSGPELTQWRTSSEVVADDYEFARRTAMFVQRLGAEQLEFTFEMPTQAEAVARGENSLASALAQGELLATFIGLPKLPFEDCPDEPIEDALHYFKEQVVGEAVQAVFDLARPDEVAQGAFADILERLDTPKAASKAAALRVKWAIKLLAEKIAQDIAADPPNSDYTSISAVDFPTLPELDFGNLPFEVRTAVEIGLRGSSDIIPWQLGIFKTLEKVAGAIDAGDTEFECLQWHVFNAYRNSVVNALDVAAKLDQELILAISSLEGTPVEPFALLDPAVLSKEDVVAFQQELSRDGLPTDVVSMLLTFGVTEIEMQSLANAMVSIDPESITGRRFEDVFSDSTFYHDLGGAWAVPEPSSVVLLVVAGLSLAVVSILRRFRRTSFHD